MPKRQSTRPATNSTRAPKRSTRNPAGVCKAAETILNAGKRQSDFRIAHAIFRAHKRQERRKQNNVVMRHEMRRTYGADYAHIRRPACAQHVSRLAHVCMKLRHRGADYAPGDVSNPMRFQWVSYAGPVLPA